MKSLRSILGAQLVLGCLAAMAVILAVRTASYHGEAVERTQLGVAAAMEDVAWEIARQRRATLQGAVLLAEHLGDLDYEVLRRRRPKPFSVIPPELPADDPPARRRARSEVRTIAGRRRLT